MQNTYLSQAALALLAFLAVGCSTSPSIDYSKAGLVDVSGSVTMDGEPLQAAVITFEMPDGQFSFGETDAEGRYSLQFDSFGKLGVTPGPKVVRISTTKKVLGLNAEEGETPKGEESTESSPQQQNLELVPARYNKDSDLKVKVEPSKSQTFDFDLKSDGKA
jgi:hypothetical protein